MRLALALCLALAAACAFGADMPETRPGGPLAGLELPLFPTQYGEPAGFPGCIPEMRETKENGYVTHSPDGMAPQEYLYPGSVEHWHAYFFKYLPMQPMFTQQSLLRNWVARRGGDKQYGFAELPNAAGRVEQYAEPVVWVPRHWAPQHTGKFLKPVPVVRAKVGDAAFELDCGELDAGLYSVRVIGAVEAEHIQRHRLPLYMRMTVNDKIDGGETTYRIRGPYVDEFYAVAEFYFNAPVRRRYTAKIAVEEGTRVELLIHNIDLHDCLAGHERRAIKAKRTLTADVPVATKLAENTQPRLDRDAELWDSFPPMNFHLSYVYGMGSNDGKSNWPNVGAGGKTRGEVEEEWGAWSWRIRGLGDTILKNDKLKLEYTLSDYRAGKPLPDPYPYKDRGMGIWTPAAKEGEKPQNMWVVPEGLWRRMRACQDEMGKAITKYQQGNEQAGRDAAILLCRIAYQFPTITARNTMHAVVIQPGSWGRDHGCRRRDPQRGALNGLGLSSQYDMLFDLIKADEGLAQSVGRFIPWVRTPQDVIELLDTYLVQTTAKRILRYHVYSSNVPARILQPAICLGDNEYTQPWLDWLFTSTFIYPLPPSGLQDLMISGNDRNGMGYIASHYYAHGEQAAPHAMALAEYIKHGGDRKYDLSDPVQYPKPLAACHWYIDSRTAGNYFPRIGDVCGPDKRYGHPFTSNKMESQCAIGWRWTKDPKFAWFLANGKRPKDFSDEEWAEVTQAASTVKRAPYWENRSRVLINWGGFLESGVEFTDARFRRSAMVRIGQGWGHHHDDTLDLQLHAHGLPMTIDGGQRPGYTNPGDRKTRTHNLVEVDGKDWLGHAWVNALSEVEDARYLSAQAQPPANQPDVRLYRRQVALVDVDEGPFKTAPAEPIRVPLDSPSPNSYVFDVVRVAGGSQHTHCFHAMLEDELTSNADEQIALDKLEGEEATYASRFERNVADFPQSSKGFAGRAPAVLEATWRWQRERQGRTGLNEQQMNTAIYDANSPRKYTRLHLFGQKGARVMTAWSHCKQWKYGWTNLFTQRKGENLESVFPSIIEMYAGEPFITERGMLSVDDNDTDARKAVALYLRTSNGHRDICFADGRPEKTRTITTNLTKDPMKFAAEFACVSHGEAGLRLATLTGGTLLEAAGVRIAPKVRERTGKITAVDYTAKTITLDAKWPVGVLKGRVFEVGMPGHMTTYTIASAAPAKGGTRITLTEGADFYVSRVKAVDTQKNIVYSTLAFTHNEKNPCPGVDKHWVASNEARTKFWRAEYLGDIDGTNRYAFQFDGPVAMADFGKLKGIRLWEIGVGDVARMSTFAAARRTDEGWQVTGDVEMALELPGNIKRTVTTDDLAKAEGALTLK